MAKYTLDVGQRGRQLTIEGLHVGDNGFRIFDFSFCERGKPFPLPDGCIATIYATLPGGVTIYETCTIEDDSALYELRGGTDEPSITAKSGKVNCEIRITDSEGNIITSPKFAFIIDKVIQDDDAIEAQESFSALTDALARTERAVDEAKNAVDEAQIAVDDARAAALRAEKAVSIAGETVILADSATAKATEAANNAKEAAEKSNIAVENANNAVKKAEDAESRFEEALENANDAVENANDAVENANDAITKANKAVNTANSAAGVANTAVLRAEALEEDLNTALDRVSGAETGLDSKLDKVEGTEGNLVVFGPDKSIKDGGKPSKVYTIDYNGTAQRINDALTSMLSETAPFSVVIKDANYLIPAVAFITKQGISYILGILYDGSTSANDFKYTIKISATGTIKRTKDPYVVSGGGTGGGVSQETDPTVPDWAKASTKPTYTASEVGADPKGTAESKVSAHNTNNAAHNDIRLLIEGLSTRLNTVANSSDTDLDQLSELVAYIKANRTLIESITTSKVSVSDIVNNLTTNVTNRPLSAAQGVALKALIDAISVPTNVSAFNNDAKYITQTEMKNYVDETILNGEW